MIDIRGEYWIDNGHVDFADGNVGDQNHESIAVGSVVSQYGDDVFRLARELGVPSPNTYGEYDPESLAQLLQSINYHLTEGPEGGPDDTRLLSDEQAEAYVLEKLDCNKEAWAILNGGGDGRMYVMKYENWIAVRGMNIEVYGYDESKRNSLEHGIENILFEEGHEDIEDPDGVDFGLYDHRTNRNVDLTLADIRKTTISLRPSVAQTALHVPAKLKLTSTASSRKDGEENKYGGTSPSVPDKWNAAAQAAGIIPPGHALWRGTSEGTSHFSAYVRYRQRMDGTL